MPRGAVIAAGDVSLVDLDERPPGPGQVRVRCEHAAAKHGTELASVVKRYGLARGAWDPALALYRTSEDEVDQSTPMGIGNMCVGAVTDVGPDTPDVAIGDRLLVYGSFAETVTATASRSWTVPDAVDWRSAVCLDPAQFALGAIRDGGVRVGDTVAVFGLGAIGLMAVQLARIAGAATVIALDPIERRRAAATACGADLVLDPTAVDAGLEIKQATPAPGADVVIEYSGSVHALQAALRGVAHGGTVVCGAYPPAYPAGLDLGAEAHLNVPNIVFSRAVSDPNRDHPRWNQSRLFDACWSLILDGRLTGVNVVDPIVAFEDLPTEYPKIVTQPEASIKLGVTFS